MRTKPVSVHMMFAFALVMLMAWAGHTSALFMGASQSAWSGKDSVQSHIHGHGVSACAACADHYHSLLAADHVHETPYLNTLLSISALPERAQPIEAPRYSIPPNPIFLIERPPRRIFML
ncbi:hypothetical protein [Pseudomonas sp. Q2-TVG4-2]|uniref:hypothetical protein n=1 Tax=Pseudomonas sp. Q2-TVG4-2 TaxID=1685699 RepID=UPI0015E7488B|nr:hypothetical protein [Pseudomonas sp. Q2-TVG4-2]